MRRKTLCGLITLYVEYANRRRKKSHSVDKNNKIMKKTILLSILAFAFAMPLCGQQRLARGERAPGLQVKEWVSVELPAGSRAMFVEFFHPSNATSVDRARVLLDVIAKDNAGRLNVVVVTHEDSPQVRELLAGKAFFAAIDDEGKTFSSYSALYVPYAVIVDRRGRVAWLGNPSTLTAADITELIK